MEWPQHADNLMGFCLETFGEETTFTPSGGAAAVISGIFEAAHVVIDTGGEVPVETVKPVLKVRPSDFSDADLSDPARGDLFTIRSVDYKVVEFQSDGHAEATVILMRA